MPLYAYMPFFCQNFEGGGGFAKSGLPTKSIPPSTCGKTPIETYHQLSAHRYLQSTHTCTYSGFDCPIYVTSINGEVDGKLTVYGDNGGIMRRCMWDKIG